MTDKIRINYEVVYAIHSDDIRVEKDTGSFGGPNKWRICIKDADGRWDDIQWVCVERAERIVGKSLTRYPEPDDRYS